MSFRAAVVMLMASVLACADHGKLPVEPGSQPDYVLQPEPFPPLVAETGTNVGKPLGMKVLVGTTPVPNVWVRWLASNGGSAPDSTLTDGAGLAMATWRLGAPGPQTLRASVGEASFVFGGIAVPVPATIELPDTVRFTAQGQFRQILTVRDAAGNVLSSWDALWSIDDGTIAMLSDCGATTHCSWGARVYVRQKLGTARVIATIRNRPTIADTMIVVADFAPARVLVDISPRNPAGIYEPTMLAGESRRLKAVIVDSNGYAIPGAEPPTLASESPGVIAVTDSSMEAITLGTAVLTGRWRNQEMYRAELFVLPQLPGAVTMHPAQLPSFSGCALSTGIRASTSVVVVRRPYNCTGPGFGALVWTAVPLSSGNAWTPVSTTIEAAVRADGTVLTLESASGTHTLRATSATGSPLWQTTLPGGGGAPTQMAVSSAGRIFVRFASTIGAYTAGGAAQWTESVQARSGIVALGDSLYAVDSATVRLLGADGAVRSTVALPASAFGQQALASDGTLFLNLLPHSLAAVSPSAVLWTKELAGPRPFTSNLSWLAVDPANNVYAFRWSEIASYSLAGSLRWKHPYLTMFSHPAVATDGAIYAFGFATASGHLFKIDAATGALLGRTLERMSTPYEPELIIGLVNGAIIGSDGSRLHVLETSFGPAAGWSQHRGTAGRTNSPHVP